MLSFQWDFLFVEQACWLAFLAPEQLKTLPSLQYSLGKGKGREECLEAVLNKKYESILYASKFQRVPRDLVMLNALIGEEFGPYLKHPQPKSCLHITSTFLLWGSWDLTAAKSARLGSFCVCYNLSSMDGTGNCSELCLLSGVGGAL